MAVFLDRISIQNFILLKIKKDRQFWMDKVALSKIFIFFHQKIKKDKKKSGWIRNGLIVVLKILLFLFILLGVG